MSFDPEHFVCKLLDRRFDVKDRELRHRSWRQVSPPIAACFSLDDFDEILWAHQQHYSDFLQIPRQNVETYAVKAISRFDGYSWALEQYAAGHSLVINHLERYHPGVADLVYQFEVRLGVPAAASAFLTPPASSCFLDHFDTIEVFFLQIDGEKQWRLRKPLVPLPLHHQKFIPGERELPPVESVLHLRPTDVLYLAHGHIHGGATEHLHSLHITIGLQPRRHLDRLIDSLRMTATEHPSIRGNAPLGAAEYRRITGAFSKDFQQILSRSPSEKLPARQRFEATRPVGGPGLLRQRNAIASLRANSLVHRFRGRRCHYELDQVEGTLSVYLPSIGAETFNIVPAPALRVPYYVAPALDFMNGAPGNFRPRDIPGQLSLRAKKLLVRRLIDAGLLVRSFS